MSLFDSRKEGAVWTQKRAAPGTCGPFHFRLPGEGVSELNDAACEDEVETFEIGGIHRYAVSRPAREA